MHRKRYQAITQKINQKIYQKVYSKPHQKIYHKQYHHLHQPLRPKLHHASLSTALPPPPQSQSHQNTHMPAAPKAPL